jgi:hypothetical protein
MKASTNNYVRAAGRRLTVQGASGRGFRSVHDAEGTFHTKSDAGLGLMFRIPLLAGGRKHLRVGRRCHTVYSVVG